MAAGVDSDGVCFPVLLWTKLLPFVFMLGPTMALLVVSLFIFFAFVLQRPPFVAVQCLPFSSCAVNTVWSSCTCCAQARCRLVLTVWAVGLAADILCCSDGVVGAFGCTCSTFVSIRSGMVGLRCCVNALLGQSAMPLGLHGALLPQQWCEHMVGWCQPPHFLGAGAV
jgi:hypothetical protein